LTGRFTNDSSVHCTFWNAIESSLLAKVRAHVEADAMKPGECVSRGGFYGFADWRRVSMMSRQPSPARRSRWLSPRSARTLAAALEMRKGTWPSGG
jgi:hypothetical protein